MHQSPLTLAVLTYFALVGLFYFIGAITMICYKIFEQIIIAISDRYIRKAMVDQNLFYNQSKVILDI